MPSKIKYMLLCIAITGFANSAYSQKNSITVNFFSVLGEKIELKYERTLSAKFSTGLYGAVYTDSYTSNAKRYKGFKVSPFVRYYMETDAPQGFFAQCKGVVGNFDSNIEYVYPGKSYGREVKTNFTTFGGAFDIGYQWILKGVLSVEIIWGVQFLSFPVPNEYVGKDGTIYQRSEGGTLSGSPSWWAGGPGSYFNTSIRIGAIF